MPLKDDNNRWYSPVYIYSCCVDLVKEKGIDYWKKQGKFQKLIESRDLSIIALLLYKLNKGICGFPFVQICKNDPPDGYVIQPSKINKGQFDIIPIELTGFDGRQGKSLLEQLQDSKLLKDRSYNGCVVVVKIKIAEEIDYGEIRDYLNNRKIRYPIWAIKVFDSNVDTICELVIINPETKKIIINIGESAYKYQKENRFKMIIAKRTGSVERVRVEKANDIDPKYLDRNFGWLN